MLTHSRFSAHFFWEKRAEKNDNEQPGKYKSVKKMSWLHMKRGFWRKDVTNTIVSESKNICTWSAQTVYCTHLSNIFHLMLWSASSFIGSLNWVDIFLQQVTTSYQDEYILCVSLQMRTMCQLHRDVACSWGVFLLTNQHTVAHAHFIPSSFRYPPKIKTK